MYNFVYIPQRFLKVPWVLGRFLREKLLLLPNTLEYKMNILVILRNIALAPESGALRRHHLF